MRARGPCLSSPAIMPSECIRGHTDLGARVDVNPTVTLTTYTAAHSVSDAHNESTSLFAITVGRFARLRDKEADVVSEDRGVSVEEIARQLYHYRQFCQLFQYLSRL
ncbi:unnamed protein product [Oppiella nova]|uniref:Uncharacterized protein n=1 Tax=Oppiella nova TaxID=334625 RepID=A0A7R9LBR7_9ACAR|nr:unnamed protein product [Oppiella nova]CAG2161416.1 unnamed protein product [Oppiella nova]